MRMNETAIICTFTHSTSLSAAAIVCVVRTPVSIVLNTEYWIVFVDHKNMIYLDNYTRIDQGLQKGPIALSLEYLPHTVCQPNKE